MFENILFVNDSLVEGLNLNPYPVVVSGLGVSINMNIALTISKKRIDGGLLH